MRDYIARMELRGISLGISPCPNDTFIFYHLLNRQEFPFRIKVVIADVEELNRLVLGGMLDVSKVSYALAARVMERYMILDSGSALGRGCGPLILGKRILSRQELRGAVIAVPGEYTTASLLLRLYLSSGPGEIRPMLFSRIPGAILSGEVDAGCVIHETRFTYKEMGLSCIQDLGAWWEIQTGLPLPLGGIIARRSLPKETAACITEGIRQSIDFARANPGETAEFVKRHAQELSSGIQKKHIDLYVNEFSRSLGTEGRKAIARLFDLAGVNGICKVPGDENFMFFDA